MEAVDRAGLVLLLRIRLVLARAGRQGRQFVARGGVCGQCAPLTVGPFLDLLRHPRLVALLAVDLHHVDPRQILLHLLSVFIRLAVDHVVDVLDLVGTHVGHVGDGLEVGSRVDRGQLMVLVCAR